MDALLVTHLPNIRYLSGFTGSAGVLVVAGGNSILFTDGRYRQQAKDEASTSKVVIANSSALAAAAKWITDRKVRVIGIEADHMTVSMRSALQANASCWYTVARDAKRSRVYPHGEGRGRTTAHS